MRAEIALAAERLYREYLLETEDEAVDIALRDGGVRRDLERLVARALTAGAVGAEEAADALLAGAVAGSGSGVRHELALAAFRAHPARRPPAGMREFLDRAGVPSLWGDAYAAAALEDGRGALFRLLVQVEMGPAGGGRRDHPPVTVDARFSGDRADAGPLRAVATDAVAAAFGVLRAGAVGPALAGLEGARAVRVYRGGLRWPLARDTAVPTPFQVEQDTVSHDGPSMGLAIALATLHAFLPQWTLRTGPVCAATGLVTAEGTVEAVGGVEAKARAAASAEVPFLYPARGSRERTPYHRQVPVDTLAAAAAEAFRLAGPDVEAFLGQRPERLYERDAERQALARAWAAAAGARPGPRMVLVLGGSGIGKSGLVADFVAEAAGAGAPAVLGRAKSHETRVLEPVMERFVDGLTAEQLRSHARTFGPWLASLVEHLATSLPDHFGAPPATMEAPTARLLLERKSRAVEAVVRACAQRRAPLLVVLDDLQWAGDDTWPVLRRLLDPSGPPGVLVVATYRPDAPGASVEAAATLADMRAQGAVEDLTLTGLTGAALRSWVGSQLPATVAGEAISQALEAVTAGNPLDVANHLRLLRERAEAGDDDLVGAVYAVGPEVIDRRLRVFSGLRTLQLASMVRRNEFSALLLGEAGIVGPDVVAADLAAATAARFVKPAGPGRYAFEHDRTRDAVRRSVPPAEAARFNVALAQALERKAEAEAARPPVVELARYYGDAAPSVGGDVWKRALRYAEQAAEEMTRRLGYEDVREFRERAVQAFDLAEVELPERRARLLLEAGRSNSYVGEEARARPFFEEAREIALDAALPDVVIEATLGLAGPPEDLGRTDDQLIGWLEEATAMAEGSAHPQVARLRGRTTFELVMAARRDPRAYPMPAVAKILEDARRSGDPVALAWALLSRLLGHYTYHEAASERLAVAEETLAVAIASGERDVEAWAHGFRIIHLLELGERSAAEQALEGLATLGPRLHHGYARWGAAVIRPLFAHLDGRFAESRRLSDEALGLRVDSLTSVVYLYVQRMLAFREEGRFSGIGPLLDRVAEATAQGSAFEGIGLAVQAARAALACDEGRFDDARRVIDDLVHAGWQHSESDAMWSTSLAFLAEACAATGDLRLVPTLYDLLRPRSGQTVVVGLAIASLGPVDRYLGILAGLGHRWDDAAAHFEMAIEVGSARLRSPTWEGHTRVDFAEMLTRRGGAGDRERAREMAEAAAATAARLPLPRVLTRARALLGRLPA
ncbi:MAG: ATP-binding protein [Acidimicrobiia bacterium]